MHTKPCPVCGTKINVEACPTAPFCSVRCREIDLGRWLDERYALPRDLTDEEEPNEPTSPENEAG